MARKKILVTGGAGYIGAHTSLVLHAEGYEPVILDNLFRSDETLLSGLEKLMGVRPVFINGDCTDVEVLQKLFREHKFAGVMHFAALKSVGESVQIPLTYYRNNIGSLTSLLLVMQQFGVRDLIFSSSCTVYGEPDHVPVSESAPIKKAESPYGATKQMCERILEDAAITGFRIASLRYFNPIGAHESAVLGELPIGTPSNLVPFITQTAIGKRKELVIFGSDYKTPDGTCIRDYIHVMDVANAHVKAIAYLEKQNGSFFDALNLGSGTGVSVLELVNRFIKVSGVSLNYRVGPRRPGDVEKTFAEPTKANRLLNWKTTKSIDQGLLDAWNWEKALAVGQS
jgi:UDP-glucose 4-epimerase